MINKGALIMCLLLMLTKAASADTYVSDKGWAEAGGTFPNVTYTNLYPRGYQYNGITYAVFHGLNLDPYILSYNHATNTADEAVYVGDNPLTNDSHGNPSMIVDALGIIHVFYGCHNSQGIQHASSTYAGNITDWTDNADISSSATYPQAFKLSNGNLIIFYRETGHGGDWVYRKSTDNGLTWGNAVAILRSDDSNTSYLYAEFNKKKATDTFGVLVTEATDPTANTREDLYYIELDSNLSPSTIGDVAINAPVTLSTLAQVGKVYESSGLDVRHRRPEFDSSENPYFLMRTNNVLYFCKYNAGWETHSLDLMGTFALDIEADDDMVIYGDATSGQVDKYTTADSGDTWSKQTTLAVIGKPIKNLALIDNYNVNAKLFFYTKEDDENWAQIYLLGDSGLLEGPRKMQMHSDVVISGTDKVVL